MKHISTIHNLRNLQAIIRTELRDLGIKVPKSKKSKRGPLKQQDGHKGQIFGCHLVHVHCVYVPDCGYVARFLVDAAKIIQQNIEQEGVFRKAGAITRQKEIRLQLEDGKGFGRANVYDVTVLVKQFFRELPEPLFTSVYHDAFIRCYQLEKAEDSRRAILLLCMLLPPEHISTLRFIMQLLAEIAQHSDSNKMDSNNLAVVLAPNIMHVNSKSETMKSCEEKLLQVQTSVVELLIQNADYVGMVEDDIVEKTTFMSEVFSTDDDLDVTDDDNLEDTKENQKKDNKRKRSRSFQGFVSSITHSISKWRRSGDGKSNVSGVSKMSNVSAATQPDTNDTHDQTEDARNVYQYSVVDGTPVVKKKNIPMTEGRAFSAAKKNAILKILPNQATLASTPFTPALTMKRLDANSMKRGTLETPSIPPRPHTSTKQSMKISRKKLTLFSPVSTSKKKRYSSSSNLSTASGGRKASRNIFRRLSGSKGDQVLPCSVHTNVSQRLGSPTSSATLSAANTSVDPQLGKSITEAFPIAALPQNSSFTSLCEQSIVSNDSDECLLLNEGFIVNNDKEVDMLQMISDPVVAGCHDAGEYVMLRGAVQNENEYTCLGSSWHSSKTPDNSQFCVDGTFNGSAATRKSSLKRGQPNSLKAGLLHGNQKEVQKLRRSFGLDKSDISFPIPVSVADTSDSQLYVQLDCSLEYMNTTKHITEDNTNITTALIATGENNCANDSTGSIPSLPSNVINNSLCPTKCDSDDYNDYFSVGPASNVASDLVPVLPNIELHADGAESECQSYGFKKTLVDQKQESKDSLLSNTSSTSLVLTVREHEMTRSLSADSGKGSMCEEQQLSRIALKDSIMNPMLDEEALPASTNEDSVGGFVSEMSHIFGEIIEKSDLIEEHYAENIQRNQTLSQKSVSSQDLQREFDHTPAKVSRSKSLIETSLMQRKHNSKPNLQISTETHKLITRVGYIKEHNEANVKSNYSDSVVPKFFPFTMQSEILRPRRESITDLLRNNAGHVKNNVMQFNRDAEDKNDQERLTSPLRFPNSTSRKRDMTRIKHPSLAHKGENDIEASKEAVNNSKEKVAFGTARLPVSTKMSLIKPSELIDTAKIDPFNHKFKRKPNIYHVDNDDLYTESNKYPKVSLFLQHRLCSTAEIDEPFDTATESSQALNHSVMLDSSDDPLTQLRLNELPSHLEVSLQSHDLEDICNKKVNVTQYEPTKQIPEIKQSILLTPIGLESMSFRTTSNKTPVDILKTAKSPKSPVKPLKRLGSSPHRNMRSPKLVIKRSSVLSTVLNQNENLQNL